MKKIAVVTLFGNTNYGNRLQNYAVQAIFEEKGFQVDTLDFYAKRTSRLKSFLKQEISLLSGQPAARRNRLLQKYNKDYIHVRPVYAPRWKIPASLNSKYDYFAVGSDQVWNPEIRKDQRDIMFLSFADKEKRIAVSPSIGVSRIEDRYVEDYRRRLDGFPYLSCREKAGAKEIERITGRDCQHLPDPTLVLSGEKWRALSAVESFAYTKKYAFVFFLNKIRPEIRQLITDYCGKKNLEIKIMEGGSCSFEPMSPFGFIHIIDQAQMVFTDSFHGTAFSINLETPFYVFSREGGSTINSKTASRIESLLALFHLEDRFNADAFTDECDFSQARTRLDEEREQFRHFLDLSLKRIEEEE